MAKKELAQTFVSIHAMNIEKNIGCIKRIY